MRRSGQLVELLERHPGWALLCISLTHALAWILLPILTQPNAPLDTLEMIYWGREWQLGYYKHPPLPGWLSAIACLGVNDAWPTYILAQIATLTCFWCVYEMGRTMLGNVKAILAVLLMQGCYYYNFTTVEFNNNVTSRVFWALAILCLYKAIGEKGKFTAWIGAGVALGLGMLSKYDTAILAAVMFAFSVFHSQGRASWRTWGPYAFLAAALLVFGPHLFWLVENDFPTITYFLKRSDNAHATSSHFISPLKFGLAQLLAVAPIALLAVPILGWKWKWATTEKDKNFDRDFLLWFSVGPFLLVMAVGVILGVHIRSMWGTAMWTYASLLVLHFVKAEIQPQSVKRTFFAATGFAVLALTIFGLRNTVLPHVRGKGSRVHYPGCELAEVAIKHYEREVGGDPFAVAGPWWEAANVAFYAGRGSSVYADADPEISPWINDEIFIRRGGLIVWERNAGTQAFEVKMLERFPELRIAAPVELKWQTSAALPPLTFAIAALPPAAEKKSPNAVPNHTGVEDGRVLQAKLGRSVEH